MRTNSMIFDENDEALRKNAKPFSFLVFSAIALIGLTLVPTGPARATSVTTERITVPDAGEEAAPPGARIPSDAMEDDSAETEAAEPKQPVDLQEETPTATQPDMPIPQIHYGVEGLPKPVARLRDQILEAARSGDVEKLRPVLESNEMPPTLSLTRIDDPIDFLKASSGDEEGRELLAILSEILEAGWVHVDEGTPQEMYVWPYFARYPLDKLSPPQEVELYRILTAADVEEMRRFGAYIFYRVGIGPDGTWHYFVAGD